MIEWITELVRRNDRERMNTVERDGKEIPDKKRITLLESRT